MYFLSEKDYKTKCDRDEQTDMLKYCHVASLLTKYLITLESVQCTIKLIN